MTKITVRLPLEVKIWLEARAFRTHRSATMELVALLEEARNRYGDHLVIPSRKQVSGSKRKAA